MFIFDVVFAVACFDDENEMSCAILSVSTLILDAKIVIISEKTVFMQLMHAKLASQVGTPQTFRYRNVSDELLTALMQVATEDR